MDKISGNKYARHIVSAAVIVAGTFIMAVGNMAFLNPYDIVPGGFTGFSIVLNKVFVPFVTPGVISLILNVPLFIAAFKIKGRSFSLMSLVGTVAYSVFIDLIPMLRLDLAALTDNALLAAIYGGILLGFGYGIVIRTGGSTGGSDALAGIVTAKKPSASFGTVLLFIDAFVVLFSGAAFSIKYGGIRYGIPPALYAFLVIYLSARIADYVIEGKTSSRAYFIFCSDPDLMAAEILSRVRRGVTALSAKGMYTGREKLVLYCVVLRTESALLKRVVFESDPSAFVTSANTNEVFGEGFARHTVYKKPDGGKN
ncbi:MAG: YitT family protein [Clostridiales bacterium]|jgi:uncharacterized membrane-anchored protein YitT (DUF2179 family)|nr:YitT family protein [Clostridiales bacterium]